MIILASTSVTRQKLLRDAGLSFTIERPAVDERALAQQNPQWTAEELAAGLAAAKARDVSARFPRMVVVGADQVLACGDRIYNKPSDLADCRSQLLSLKGRSHRLISAVACAQSGEVTWADQRAARLRMRSFSDEFLDHYLSAMGDDCLKSVGGYQVEGRGIQLFDDIEGDHSTILGLPLLPLLGFLRHSGVILA